MNEQFNNPNPQGNTPPPPPTGQPFQQPQQPPYQPPQPGAAPQQVPQMQYPYPQGTVAVAPPKKKGKKVVLIAVIAVVCLVILGIVGAMIFGAGPEKKFYGSWSSKMDITDIIKEGLGSDAELLGDDYKFEVQVDFVFNKDKTYEMSINRDAFDSSKEEFLSEIKTNLREVMLETMREALPSYSDDELLDAFERSQGETLDESIDALIEEELTLDFDAIVTSLDYKGQYKVEDDKFYLSNSLNTVVETDTYGVYEIKSNNEIYVTDYIVDGESTDDVFILPFTMVKK